MKNNKLSTRELCYIGIFVALMAVMAQIIIPIPPIPVTMQTFAIALTGAVLGAKKGTIAAVVYLLLGAVGVPVFAGFAGGLASFVGPAGGYLWSFPLLAFIVGLTAEKGGRYLLALGLIAGSVINLSMGMLHLAFVLQLDMQAAFVAGVLPFIVPEIIKYSLVYLVAPRLKLVTASLRP